MKKLLFILAIFSAASCSTQTPSESTVEHVGNQEWKTMIADEDEPIIIDVRTPDEFESGHIERAVNIDYLQDDFLSKMKELDRESTLFIYCKSGGRSGKACVDLQRAGFEHIVELKNGYDKWVE